MSEVHARFNLKRSHESAGAAGVRRAPSATGRTRCASGDGFVRMRSGQRLVRATALEPLEEPREDTNLGPLVEHENLLVPRRLAGWREERHMVAAERRRVREAGGDPMLVCLPDTVDSRGPRGEFDPRQDGRRGCDVPSPKDPER